MAYKVGSDLTDRPLLVILGGTEFRDDVNQTPIQMARSLSRSARVVYVCRQETAGIPSELRKSRLLRVLGFPRGLIRSCRPSLCEAEDNLFVLYLPYWQSKLPLARPEILRRLHARLIQKYLGQLLRRWPEYENIHLLAYWWMFPEIVRLGHWSRTLFDVIDLHWEYEGHSPETREMHRDLLIRTAQTARQNIVVSERLRDSLQSFDIQSEVVGNSIDLALTASIRPRHERGVRVAIYAGGWNGRINKALLAEVALARADWVFRVVGTAAPEEFPEISNVHFLGAMSYQRIISEIKSANVGLAPFVRNNYTESSDFLKILDYVACGVPVLGTDIASLRKWEVAFPDAVRTSNESHVWSSALDQLAEVPDSEVSQVRMRPYDVSRRAEKIQSVLGIC